MRYLLLLIFFSFSAFSAQLNRTELAKKLHTTIIPKVGNLEGFSMEEAIKALTVFSNNKINFIYFPQGLNQKLEAPNLTPHPQIDPVTGLPSHRPAPAGLGGVQVGGIPPYGNVPLPLMFPAGGLPPAGANLTPPMGVGAKQDTPPSFKIVTGELHNLTVKQLMDIMVMGMRPPVQYFVMDYGVIFTTVKKNEIYMPTRTLQIRRPITLQPLRR